MTIKHVISEADMNEFMEKMREREKQARAEGFKAGVEAAAKEADKWETRTVSDTRQRFKLADMLSMMRTTGRITAEAIRALKDNGGEGMPAKPVCKTDDMCNCDGSCR